MDASTFDPVLDQPLDAPPIPGIHNYCDRCCHRCPFTRRCVAHRDSEAELRAVADDPTASVAAVVKQSLSRSVEVMRQIAERLGIDVDLTPEDEAMEHQRLERVLSDPLVRRSREYARSAYGIVRALAPLLVERGDGDLIDAVTRIEETCGTIASKIYRAVSGADDDSHDPADLQDDANGSAKVARLLVEDARSAWRTLMEAGRAAADGVPARLVALLDEIDSGVSMRFPRAMEFVRPGFDEQQDVPSS
jgi:hypothetical protein